MTLIPIWSCKALADGLSRSAIGLPLFAYALFPAGAAAQGEPVANGPMLPLALWCAGAAVLGLVIAYAIFRNRTRTRADKRVTEQATKNLYAEEERKRTQ
ncbi:MAG: hypothetical protein QOD09_507 [Bradyrhizobium sp.]|jgi:NhaP-type Na+/H+ or K+/H+ antiporter|nr:hypothetical protein [Bradyrhizobium sp.]